MTLFHGDAPFLNIALCSIWAQTTSQNQFWAAGTAHLVLTARQQIETGTSHQLTRFISSELNKYEARIDVAQKTVGAALRTDPENYVWETFSNVDELINTRLASMRKFLKDL